VNVVRSISASWKRAPLKLQLLARTLENVEREKSALEQLALKKLTDDIRQSRSFALLSCVPEKVVSQCLGPTHKVAKRQVSFNKT
jgi:UDP-glucose 6-dehydrogenase